MYNATGQLIRTLADGETRPGAYTSIWDGTDHRNRHVANGIYVCQLETEDGMTIMAADYPASMVDAARTSLSGHAISVSGDATDRFSVDWMVLLSGQAE